MVACVVFSHLVILSRMDAQAPARQGIGWSDLALTTCVLAASLAAAAASVFSTDARPLDRTGAALLVLSVLPTVVRNRWPLGALVVATLFAAPYHAIGYPHEEAFPAILVLIYTVALRCSRTRMIAAVGLILFIALATAVLSAWLAGTEAPGLDMLATLSWPPLAAAAGLAVRSHRSYLAAVTERAERAEHSREQEAARRVAEERLRIARDLHDVLAHTIVVINAHAGVAAHLLDRWTDCPPELKTSLRTITSVSGQALSELRATLDVLRAPDTESSTAEGQSPTPTLDRLTELAETARRAGLAVTVDQEVDRSQLGTGLEVTLYRIAQEAMTNVIRHAKATTVSIRVDQRGDHVRLQVTDDGSGAGDGNNEAGYGMLGMRERAHAMGGRLTAMSLPEKGFQVLAELPLRPHRGD